MEGMLMIRDLIISNRSCRRFHEEAAVERGTLEELVDLARLSASAGNLQPLKYLFSHEPQENARVFRTSRGRRI
jgi:nitroreductase